MTRPRALLLLLLLLPPHAAPAGPPRRVDATAYGVVADGKAENSAALQRAVDAAPDGGTVDLPAGIVLCRWPVYVDRPNVHVRGAGRGVTVLKPQYGQIPPLVFGFRRAEYANQTVTAAHRPDAFGVLDATVAPRAGVYRGYSTQGNSNVVAVAGPPQLGVISPTSGGRVFDGWGAVDGWTFEAALRFRGGLPANGHVAGVGDSANPGPWQVGTDAQKRLTVCFRTSDVGSELSARPVRVFRAAYPDDGKVHRLRTWVKFAGPPPRVGIAVDGVDLPLEATSGIDDFPRFAKNLGQYPFFLGGGAGSTIAHMGAGPQADFDVYGLRVSRTARTTEPADDKGRYVPDWTDPTAVFWLDHLSPPGVRHLQFGCGISTAIPVTVGFIAPTLGTLGGVYAGSVEDLTVDGGGVLVGQVLDWTARNVESVNGFVGIGSLPLEMNYPVTVDDCFLTGWHAGLSLTRSFAWVRNVNVGGSGTASMIFTGCNARVSNAMFSHFSPEAETCVLVLGDEAGGRTVLENLEVDNEDVALPSAVKCYLAPYGPSTYLSVRSLGMARSTPTRPVIDLVGTSAWPGTLDADGVVASAWGAPAAVGKGWTATVSGVPYLHSGPVNPGASSKPAR